MGRVLLMFMFRKAAFRFELGFETDAAEGSEPKIFNLVVSSSMYYGSVLLEDFHETIWYSFFRPFPNGSTAP